MIIQLVVCRTIIISKKYKMITIDLSKQQALDAYPKTIKQINFTGNLEEQGKIFFIIEEAKRLFYIFHKAL